MKIGEDTNFLKALSAVYFLCLNPNYTPTDRTPLTTGTVEQIEP